MSLAPESFQYVRTLARKEAAIVLEAGKEYLVEARLLPLAKADGVADVDVFVAGLRRTNDRRTIQRVVDALTTNETSWMRDIEPFQALVSDILPAIMSKPKLGGTRTVNIWSAACSSGQEPYGIAMISEDLLRTSGWKAEILATDISLEMLERAQEGLYSQLEVNRGLPATLLVKHFVRAGTHWKISDDIRRKVSFRQVNLSLPFPPLPMFDVIFLRNVLIYFDVATKRAILQRMHQVLRPDGYLILGGAETTLGIDDEWERVKLGRSHAHKPKEGPGTSIPAPRRLTTSSVTSIHGARNAG